MNMKLILKNIVFNKHFKFKIGRQTLKKIMENKY